MIKKINDYMTKHDFSMLFFMIVFILFLGILQIPARADVNNYTIDSTLEISCIPDDEYSDYIIWTTSNGVIMCNKTTSDAVLTYKSSVNGYYLDVGQGYYYKLDSKTWVAYSGPVVMQISTLHYTSRVFYDTSNRMVFKLSPSHQIAQVVGIQKMILPTVLSSIKLLIPLLLVLIVSWIGLRKSLTFLKTVLKIS